jgi:hypothetical protein
VTFYAATVAPRIQLDARLLDVAPDGTRALVTRGTLTLDAGGAPLGMRRVRLATFGNLWPVAANHRLRLELTNVDSPYLRPSLVPSATAIANVELSMPIRRAAGAQPVASTPAPAAPPSPIPAALPIPTPAALPLPTPAALPIPTPAALPIPTPATPPPSSQKPPAGAAAPAQPVAAPRY